MIDAAIAYLEQNGIKDCHELSGILIIPCKSLEVYEYTISTCRRLLKECGFNKSWSVNPYYYEHQKSLAAEMFKNGTKEVKNEEKGTL